jgi:hypothetical protein
MDINKVIAIHKIIFKKETKIKNIDEYFSQNTKKNIISYSQKIWDNININIHGDNYMREYDKIDESFNIYTLFDEKIRLKLDCEEYRNPLYNLDLFHNLYEMKDINSRWRTVDPNDHLPYYDELFPIFKHQQNIKSDNYIFKTWIPRTLLGNNTIGEDNACSLNRSAYYNTYAVYAIIDDKYYIWMPEEWYCHEDAPTENDYYFIKPSIITKNINIINKKMNQLE